MVNSKKVSVVMCTYNGETHIREQLDSIVYQSYPIHELIVQDDHSTDNTVKIIHEYASEFPFIKLIVNKERLGYNHNFLSALLKAEGDVIALADQDDIWHKEKIRKQIHKLEEGFLLVFHNSLLFKESPSKPLRRRYIEPPLISGLRLALKPFIPGHECLFTKEILPTIRKIYELENKISFDSVIALTCFTLGRIAYLDEELVYWRRHQRATTYAENRKSHGSITGMIKSLSVLTQRKNREIIRRYFQAISTLPFGDEATRKVVDLLHRGTWQLFRACFICSQHTTCFFRTSTSRNRIKAAFTPLHLIRDGVFLIR